LTPDVAAAAPSSAEVAATGTRAEEGAAAPGAAAPPVCKPPGPGAYTHDGFFARAGVGVAYALIRVGPATLPSPRRTWIRGFGQASKILLGGTPLPGFVVGGSIATERIDPTFVEGGVAIIPDDDSVKVTLVRLGPFVEWYPSPGRGFHVGAGASLALQVETDVKGDPISPGFMGGALSMGFGYEAFTGEDLSLGVSAEVTFGGLSRDADGVHETMTWTVPALVLAATYH
jgi:hypothetical protein